MVVSAVHALAESEEPILLDLIIRIVVSLGALLGAAAAAQNLISENNLDWTGNHLLDTVLFWGLCLFVTTALSGPLGGWAFISALSLSLLVACLGVFAAPTWSSIAFLVIVLTTVVLSIKGKAWRVKGADLSEKKQKKQSGVKNERDQSILKKTAKTGLVITMVTTLFKQRSTQRQQARARRQREAETAKKRKQ